MTSPAPPHNTTTPPARPWWIAAGVVVVLGLLLGLAWSAFALLRVVDRPSEFARTTVPGSVAVQLARGDRSVVYVESDRSTPTAGVVVSVTGPEGETVSTGTIRGDIVYDVPNKDGRRGTAVKSFAARTDGAYTITASSDAGAVTLDIAVGLDLSTDTLWAIGAPGAFFLGSLVLAVIVAATPWARRRRASTAGPSSIDS